MKKRTFGELELAILTLLKKEGMPSTVRDVLTKLDPEDKYTTVMTVMNRLVAKGELHRKRHGLSYRYFLKKQRLSIGLFERFRQKMFGGKSALMIHYLLGSGEDLTEEELQQIERLIEQTRKKGGA